MMTNPVHDLMTAALFVLGALLLVPASGLRAQQTDDSPTDPPAVAQGEELPRDGRDITLVLEGEQRPQLRLAFPAPTAPPGMSPPAVEAAQVFESTLRQDLRQSGIFAIQGRRELEVLDLTGDLAHDFEQYRSLGNEVVLLTEVREEDGRLVVEGRLYDLSNGEAILGKRYRGGFELARRIAHTFADEIVLYFTGRRGISLTSIAFVSDRGGNKEIYLMDYDGANQRPVTDHNSISLAPDWSPTGDALGYVSFFAGPASVYLLDLESGVKRPVVANDSFSSSPSFSPEGGELAFSRSLGGNTEIFIAERDGENLRRLTHSSGIDTNPAWSPKGGEIAFTSSRAGSPHIYLVDTEGANLRRVTFEGSFNDDATWSPDGSLLAYATRLKRNGSLQIAVTEVATGETHVLTSGAGNHESPTFSPDGRWLAFSHQLGGTTQVYAMKLDGSERRSLTSEGNSTSPSWSAYPPR